MTTHAAALLDAYIGVDVGGTHTDVAALVGTRLERGKAFTTYDDFSRGVLDAVAVAAGNHGLTLDALLKRTRLFVNGTTVVTNAITTLRGSRVGVIVTAGFKDTFRFGGGPRIAEFDDHLQVNPPRLFAANAVVEADERIDWAGHVLVPLNETQLLTGVQALLAQGDIDALAVCLLNSYRNPVHELRVLELLHAIAPDMFVTLSHNVFPVRGENRRWTTAVLNSFVQRGAAAYLDTLSTELRAAGLAGALTFFAGLGGGLSLSRARDYPLALLGSGPAGGAIGANALARRMGIRHALIGDMGGTSFDTGIIVDNSIHIEKNIDLGLIHTGVNIVDVVSVGTGGGSIAWLGERGVPQVGPQSASSEPGPAAYGRGGRQATVTDAMLILGFIDAERYLGGRFQLQPALARQALLDTFAAPFGWSAEQAASAIHDLVVVNMASAMREVSVEKGHDPRSFTFIAYGGTLPLFAMQIAERLGMSEVVIPHNSSCFCALGLLAADFVLRFDRTVAWDLSHAAQLDEVNTLAAQMVEQAHAAMRAEGFAEQDIRIVRSADFRFSGQSYELTLALPDRPLNDQDRARLTQQFFETYEKTYGEGTAWRGVATQLLTLTVTVTGLRAHADIARAVHAPRSAADIMLGTRRVFLPSLGAWQDIAVYDDHRFTCGSRIDGPAIIDASDTTLYVPPGCHAQRDEFMNYTLSRLGAPS